MAKWLNEWRKLHGPEHDPHEVVDSFECDCAPDTRAHQVMVRGALINANRHEYYLRDGQPISEST